MAGAAAFLMHCRRFARHGLAVSVALVVLFSMALHYVALPGITARTVERVPQSKAKPVIFPHQMPDFWNPWRVPDNRPATYLYTIHMDYRPWQQSRYFIYPTGCVDSISVNGTHVSFDTHNSCNRDHGFAVELSPHLATGQNTINILLSNHRVFRGSRGWEVATYGLQFGPVMMPMNARGLSFYLCWAIIASTCAAITFFLRRLTGDYGIGLITSAGFLMYLRQLKYTSFMQYVIDMPSHFHYICFIARHGFAPKPMEGWEYYHPTLYYTLAAGVVRWCNWLGSFDALNGIRLFSVLCFMGCIIFCALILNRMVRSRLACYPVLLMLVLYPGSIFYSVRLDSHTLLYLFYAGSMYYLMRWIETDRPWSFWRAIICLGFAIATRSNALALLPLFGVAALYRLYKGKLRFSHAFSFGMTLSMCVLAFGLMQNFGRTTHYRKTDHTNMPLVVGNIHSIDKRQRIHNSAENLLFLNTQRLFNPPYFDWWRDSTGRQYFWNGVIKTSLFEHFRWHNDSVARRLIKLVLASAAYIFVSLCWMRMSKRREWNLCAISFALTMITLMANRVIHPYAPSQDFRYVYPVIASYCGLLGLVIEQHWQRQQHKSAMLGIAIALCLAYSSIALIRAG
jgi:hypothetical protein